jgi:hypothetical protein
MAISVALTPGRTIRWRKRRFVVVDSTGFDAIIAREVGKRYLGHIPVSEARPDHATGRRAASATGLVSVDEEEWQTAVKRFSIQIRDSNTEMLTSSRWVVVLRRYAGI